VAPDTAAPAPAPVSTPPDAPGPLAERLAEAARQRPATAHQPQQGALKQIELRAWQPDRLTEVLVRDVKVGFELLRRMPPAITFFGGARIQKDDPYYALGQEMGRLLARAGIPPRTGAGPGIMEAVPQGHKEQMASLADLGEGARDVGVEVGRLRDVVPAFKPVIDGFAREANIPASETQGFNIKLPREQKVSKSVDNHAELAEFIYRKVVLYENARGLVTFPGGFGTLDELFQVWALRSRGKHQDPLALVGSPFWGPVLDAVRKVALEDRKLIETKDFEAMALVDTAPELMRHMAAEERPRGFEEDPGVLASRMTREITEAIKVLDRTPHAVTFVGGDKLAPGDPTLGVAREAARLLTEAGVPARVGSGAPVVSAVVEGTRSADARALVQGFSLADERARVEVPGVALGMHAEEYTTHQELLTRRIDGFVALPGDLTTLHQAFSYLCQVQCKKVPPTPIILVGKDFWQPIFDEIKRSMLDGSRQTIAPEDLHLVTITDDPKVVANAVMAARQDRVAQGPPVAGNP
jgi:hypothetical protein